ncbi:FecR domain-containing protein [Chitinophagaceae bacterium 26-R-25]|nr:FecR domain-containing protein [Chitinophagaceae bacterium 26-R-25]
MNDRLAELQQLFDRYVNNSCTEDEKLQFFQYVQDDEFRPVIQEMINLQIHQYNALQDSGSPSESDEIFNSIIHSINETPSAAPVRTIRSYKKYWFGAAAIFLLFLGGAAAWLVKYKSNTTSSYAVKQPDVAAPSVSNATLTLADGSKIVLDSAQSGKIAAQGNTNIQKLANGSIAYNEESGNDRLQYNTVAVPRGSKILSLTLSDGTKVWLNAASSLKFPVSFVGHDRQVETTGEVYFEVAQNKAKPFKVTSNNITVSVLGTSFNMNTYDDEPQSRITLLEGSVRVDKAGQPSCLLKPNDQASISSKMTVTENVDAAAVIAWKNNKFDFGEATEISSVLRQVARWYDVDVVYKGSEIEGHIGGSVSRDFPLSKIVSLLEMTGTYSFKIEGKKLVAQLKNK